MSTTCTAISTNASLYTHSGALVDEFNHILAIHEKPLFDFLENTVIFSKIDFFSSVFNYWVQLIESEELRVAKVDKMIIHTFSFELHKIVKNHPLTKKFLSTQPNNETIFTFSYFFAYNFLYYLHEIMPPQLLERFIQSKDEVTYFNSTDEQLKDQLLSDLYIFRKNLLVELSYNSDSKRQLNHILYDSLAHTNTYLEKFNEIIKDNGQL